MEIRTAKGFLPNITRVGRQEAADKRPADQRTIPLDLPEFLEFQDYGGFISTSKSYAIAKNFALSGQNNSGGWVYALFVEGALHIPREGTRIRAPGKKDDIYEIFHDEQELAMPGMLDWEDVVAWREVGKNGAFTGNIGMSKKYVDDDPEAMWTIWRLLSGESQGAQPKKG